MPVNATIPPPPAELVLSADQERSLRELALMFGNATGFKLALATFSDLKLRAILIQRLTGLLEDQGVVLSVLEFTAGEPNATLLHYLKDHIGKFRPTPGHRHAVTLIGLENLIALHRVAGGLPIEGTGFLEEANLHRDTFAKACPVPLLVWLTPADTTAFAQTATDLWHWRSATFDFSSAFDDRPVGLRMSMAIADDSSEMPHSPDRLRERSALLRRQLAELGTSADSATPRILGQRANLWRELGSIYNDLGNYTEAQKCWEECFSIAEQIKDEPILLLALGGLARVLMTVGQFDKAEPLIRQAVATSEKIFGPDHPNTGTSVNDLSALLKATNRLEEAEPLVRRALTIAEKNLSPDHPNVATGLNNLALLLQETNRLAEAEPLMRRALAIGERSFGPDHPNVAIGLNNLAQLLQDTNRLGEAEPLMRRALSVQEKSFGPDHPKVAIRLSNLARLLHDTNRLAEAEPLMRRALAIDEMSFGPDHPEVATDLSNLASLLKATNRLAEAEPLMWRALAIDEKSFGPDHPEVSTDLNNLALLLKDTNRLPEAEPLMRRSVSILRKFGEANGHQSPYWKSAADNYKRLLETMNLSKPEIEAKLREVIG